MNKKLFMILTHTWGIIMTIIGYCAAAVLIVLGYKAEKYGWCYHFKLGENWGGVNLGRVIITDTITSKHTLNHEHGHAIQNALYGVLFPFIVAIPSAVRYHYRNAQEKKGKELTTQYDDIWFEGQATEWGDKMCKIYNQEEKG